MIFFETAGQARGFLLLVCAGLISGALYDLTGLIRRRLPRWMQPLPDLLWCVFVAAACLMALALGGERRVRLYALLGLCCGGGMYCLGIRALLQGINRALRKKRPIAPGDASP